MDVQRKKNGMKKVKVLPVLPNLGFATSSVATIYIIIINIYNIIILFGNSGNSGNTPLACVEKKKLDFLLCTPAILVLPLLPNLFFVLNTLKLIETSWQHLPVAIGVALLPD